MNILVFAFISSVITVAAVLAAKVLSGELSGKSPLASLLGHSGISFTLYSLAFYCMLPSLVGLAGGYGFIICAVLGYLLCAGVLSMMRDSRAGVLLSIFGGGGLALWAVVNLFAYIGVTWFPENVKNFANLAHVRIASKEEKMPPTDPNHIVMVTQDVAAFMGQQAIAQSGDNSGSLYMTTPSSYTLQSVSGHLYWIAPLIYRNAWATQMGLFSTKIDYSPGYISVDAEDPNGQAKLHTGYHIRYMPGAMFNSFLQRHVYQAGYVHGDLDDPTFEVNDEGKPYFTITYVHRAFGVAGDLIDKLLLVDAQTGEITAYNQKDVPQWIDRVMSRTLVQQYAKDWGQWHDDRSSETWPNFGLQYQMTPADYELLYNSVDKPVWVIPMTANTSAGVSNNASSTGILVYDSHDNSAIFYPGLCGLGTGDNVRHAFENSPKNIRGRAVDSVQLYQINGVPSWIAIYTQPQGEYGRSFAAIGVLEAHNLNGASVVFAEDKRSALGDYFNALAAGDGNSAQVSQTGDASKKVSGVVERIGSQMVNQQTLYVMLIKGDSHRYTALGKTSEELPLIHEGDTVTLNYLDTNQTSRAIIRIDDLTIQGEVTKK